ncbi:unnamed protein product [Nezara viridula]|uniref:Neuropeptide n=1 Tax=Nezara viridula TaxID=85310 RepID=A0A9P0HLZ9_NEZVI|nr:unnamed protein product [Nezara viridula]
MNYLTFTVLFSVCIFFSSAINFPEAQFSEDRFHLGNENDDLKNKIKSNYMKALKIQEESKVKLRPGDFHSELR